ncbi:MAG: hypothetical protein HY096_01575 [Nitrospinae bacterium]|nr:hypothetical protein [Nitrospinota bacterium]
MGKRKSKNLRRKNKMVGNFDAKINKLSNDLSVIKNKIDLATYELIKKLKDSKPVSINDNMDDISEDKDRSGCYLFEILIKRNCFIDNNFKKFEGKWNTHKNSINGYTFPRFNKKNAEEVYNNRNNYNDNWFPLYVGKAENLKDRIKEHFECETSTSALRIRLFKNHNNGFNFRIKWIKLPSNMIDYCEKNIHKELHPLIGKG